MQYLYFFLAIILLIIILGEVLLYLLLICAGVFVVGYLIIQTMRIARHRKPRIDKYRFQISSNLLPGIETYSKQFSRIIDEFGPDIMSDMRFANIYDDYYLDNDNPQKTKILRALLSLDAGNKIKKHIKSPKVINLIEQFVKTLTKQGFDKEEAEMMLYATATCYGLPVTSNGEIPFQGRINHFFVMLDKLKFLFYILPLVAVPCIIGVRIGYESKTLNLLFSQLYVFLIYLFTFGISGLYFDTKRENSFLAGYFSGANIAGLILLLLSSWISEIALRYIGIEYNYGEEPTPFPLVVLVCFVIGFICSFFISGTKTLLNDIETKKIIQGFLCALGLGLLTGFAAYHIVPLIPEVKSDIISASIHRQRQNEAKSLSFMDVQLGSNIEHNLSRIKRITPYYLTEYDTKSLPVYISSEFHLNSGESIIDSIIYCSDKTWKKIAFCIADKSVIAIVCEPENYMLDDLIRLYSEKYGLPEHDRPHISEHYEDNNPYEWNYKNCKIAIKKCGSSFYSNDLIVSYLDNAYIEMINNYNTEYDKEQERIENEKEVARRKEELNRAKQKELEELKLRKQKEQRDNKTLDQI